MEIQTSHLHARSTRDLVIPAKAAIGFAHLCGHVRRSPIHLSPATAGRGRGPTRQRWAGEGRPVPWCGAARENGGSLAVRHCEERGNRDAPHPCFAIGPSLSPLRGREVYGRCLAET